MSSGILNKKATRNLILEVADKERAHKYTRVAPEVYAYLEMKLKQIIRDIVQRQPSKGKTIYIQ